MQIHHTGTKTLSKGCHTLCSKACIKCSMITVCLQYTHGWVQQLLSGSTHIHAHTAGHWHTLKPAPQLRSRCDHKHLHNPRKTLLQVKCYIDLFFPKEDTHCNNPTRTAPCQIKGHHSIYHRIILHQQK